MALQSATGTFAINTSTGNQAITGLGFTPKIVLFFPAGANTAAGIINSMRQGFGVGVSSTDRRAISTNSQTGQVIAGEVRNHTDTKCIEEYADASSSTVLYAADLVSLDSGGFTINVTTAPASAYLMGYLALGGTDLTNVKTGQIVSNTVTGNQAVTGVGFKPDCVIFFSIDRATAPPNATTTAKFGIGFAISSTARGATSIESDSVTPPTVAGRYQRTVRTLISGSASTTTGNEYDFVSMDSDGFTINVVVAPGAGSYLHYIALKGGQYSIGSVNTPTSTGNFSVTGTGFTPVATMFLSDGVPPQTVGIADAKISLGVGVSSSARFVNGCYDQDAQVTSNSRHWLSTTRVYAIYSTAAALAEDVDFVSNDGNGFTLNEVSTDTTSRQILYLSFGSNAVVATTSSPQMALMGVGI